MSDADRKRVRDDLLRLSQRMRETGEELLGALESERVAVREADLEALESATSRKVALMDALDRMNREERAALAPAPFSNDADALQRTLSWCDNDGDLTESRARMREVLERCDGYNRQNGILLQHRMGYVRRALDALRQAQSDLVTYGPGSSTGGTGSRVIARG